MKHQFTNDQLSAAIVAAYNKANAESRQSWDEEVQGTCPLNCASLTRVAEYFLTNLPETPPLVVDGKTPAFVPTYDKNGRCRFCGDIDCGVGGMGCAGARTNYEPQHAASAVLSAFDNKTASSDVSVGDVVTLKSGGPKMTVVHAEENGEFWCQWFHTDGTISGNHFPSATLTKAD